MWPPAQCAVFFWEAVADDPSPTFLKLPCRSTLRATSLKAPLWPLLLGGMAQSCWYALKEAEFTFWDCGGRGWNELIVLAFAPPTAPPLPKSQGFWPRKPGGDLCTGEVWRGIRYWCSLSSNSSVSASRVSKCTSAVLKHQKISIIVRFTSHNYYVHIRSRYTVISSIFNIFKIYLQCWLLSTSLAVTYN